MIKQILKKMVRTNKFFGALYDIYLNIKLKKIIRIKNKKFSESGIETFQDLCKLLNERNIKFWLCYGTLLGYVRENGILKHDFDFDIGLWNDDYSKELESALESHGFKLMHQFKSITDYPAFEQTYEKNGVSIDFFYGGCVMKKYTKELTIFEQKQCALNILVYVAEFCEKNNINYILSDGTLIGAVRHNGFIPWDDDIDISMLRSDYNKFIELWNRTEGGKYSLHCFENGNLPFAFAKVCDDNTICYEAKMKRPTTGIWIDIFPLDFVPSNENEIVSHFLKMKSLTSLFGLHNVIMHSNIAYKLIQKILNVLRCIKHSTFLYLYSLKKIQKEVEKELLKYEIGEKITNYIVIQRCPEQRKYGFPVSCCTDYVYHKFEGYDFRIPRDYDTLLQSFYGDYMKLPPKEKQVCDHKIKAFYIN